VGSGIGGWGMRRISCIYDIISIFLPTVILYPNKGKS
jgi:hypothetical protein